MAWLKTAERRRRFRTSRNRPGFCPRGFEALEERTLLSLTLLHDFNRVETTPAEITGAGGDVFFVTRGPNDASDLNVKTASGVTLLKSFPATNSASSQQPEIKSLTAVGSKLFFLADVGRGQQLWATDGTRRGTQLVENFSASVTPDELIAVGNELFFDTSDANATPGANSGELLFKSDGTAAGTVAVPLPPNPVGEVRSIESPVSFHGALYFVIDNHLMMTDGTTTQAVFTLSAPSSPNMPPSDLENLIVAGGLLYFTAHDASRQGEELYASDGAASGTTLVRDFIVPSAAYGPLSNLTAAGSQDFFAVADPAHGTGLWTSNGTAAGTRFVKTIGLPTSPGVASPFPPIITTMAAGSRLFFTTPPRVPGGTDVDLWVTDGTAAGTTELAAVNQGNLTVFASPGGQFAALGGALFFTNFDPSHGMELWRSDGTVAGTRLFRNLNPGPASSFPGNMAVVKNRLYFSATAGTGSSALWASNGTPRGTHLVAGYPLQPNGDGLFLSTSTNGSAVLGNNLLFAADDGMATELWKTDGTHAGTRIVKVLNLGMDNETPGDFTTVGNKVFFDATPAETDTLWVTNGTTAGTTQIGGFHGTLTSFTPFGDRLAFIVTSLGGATSSVWVSDGTAGGTTPIAKIAGTISEPTVFQGKLAFFETNPDGTVSSLWLSDGTARGTRLVKTFPTASTSLASPSMVALGNRLLISASPPKGGAFTSITTLWVSDGTPTGTVPIAAVPPDITNVDSLTVLHDRVYFSVVNFGSSKNTQLWVTDGTSAGTHKVADLGPEVFFVDTMVVAGPKLYVFTANYPSKMIGSIGLYVSDGTAGGTKFVHKFVGELEENAAGLPDGNLAMVLEGPAVGSSASIWVSNGTPSGTRPVAGAGAGYPSPASLGPSGVITPINGRFYLGGNDPQHGTELWQSDGTPLGTSLVQDINPGPASSTPDVLAELNGHLIVAADDGRHGSELLSGPIPPGPGVFSIKPARH